MKFKKLLDIAKVPVRATPYSAGFDLFSTEDYVLKTGERKLFKTGIALSIPSTLYGRIAPRSGLAYKKGIDVMAGVIDSDYRDDVGVILINLGQSDVEIKQGDAIAQIIFENYYAPTLELSTSLDETVRGNGGFGSTDKKQICKVEELLRNIQNSPSPKKYIDIVKERE